MKHRLEKGMTLNGRFSLERVLKSGGMSEVFLAKDLKSGEIVVLKSGSAREARILSRLNHPGIVRFLCAFSEAGEIWTAQEYIKGLTLFAYVERYGPLDPEEVWPLALQLCRILTYLHSLSPPLIFRDLKPDNIVLERNGRIRLIDFGIAREYVPGEDSDTTSFGTVGYAAPEQFDGSRMQSDARTDIFGLGKVIFFLLTGIDPKEISPEEWKEAVFANVKDVAQASLILRYTEKDPERRPVSADVASYEIRNLMEGKGCGKEKRRVKKKEKREKETGKRKSGKRAGLNPVALMLTILALLIYAGGFLLGLGKAYAAGAPSGGLSAWYAPGLYWGIALLAGTFVMALGQIVKLLHDIREKLFHSS